MSTLSGLADGRYRLEVTKVGFATQSVLVDVKSGSPAFAHDHAGAGGSGFKDRRGRGDSASWNRFAFGPNPSSGSDR